MFKSITRTVWLLSLVSLFNDFSSEMLYPIIPLFLQQVGFGSLVIGIVEGITECIAGLAKMGLGKLSDQYNRRLPFIQIGYSLSVCSRPLIALTSSLGLIVSARSMDRFGKGIRTAARDALLADESTAETKAEVFGFHRSMDTFGAVLGPLSAIIYLHYHPEHYKSIFFISIIPGLLAMLMTAIIKEKRKDPDKHTPKTPPKKFWSYFQFYKEAPKAYLSILVVLLLFSLVNSSDMFLLLRAKELGFSEQHVLMMYILFNLSFALFAYPVGRFTQRLGIKNALIIGLILYAITYLIFGLSLPHHGMIWFTFILYGMYYSFTQGTIKVILLKPLASNQKASAIGFYEGLNSFCLLGANAITGFIWYTWGASVALITISSVVACIALILVLYPRITGES